MDVLMLSGEVYTTVNITTNKFYTYSEIKDIFGNIVSDKFYCIINCNERIFTNLYDIHFGKEKRFLLLNLNIIFYPYCNDDVENIKLNSNIWNMPIYDPFDTITTLQTKFNLSQSDLHTDPVFMSFCVSHNGDYLYYASDDIKNNIDVIFCSLASRGEIFKHVSSELKDNEKKQLAHIVPRRHGGTYSDHNIIITCFWCLSRLNSF